MQRRQIGAQKIEAGEGVLAGDERFDINLKRLERRAEVTALINEVFSSLSATQVVAKLDAAGIANARVNTVDEVWEHPQLKARGRWHEMGSPQGPLPALLPPATHDGFAPRFDPVPGIGEHTGAILEELGYRATDVAQLKADGAI